MKGIGRGRPAVQHEPECIVPWQRECICEELRACEQRVMGTYPPWEHEYRRGYREGYNAHARSVQHWQDTHGAYRQHGEGENP